LFRIHHRAGHPHDGGDDVVIVIVIEIFSRGFLNPSLNESRMYNLKCWIYGSDPVANAGMLTDGSLPANRAGSCPQEYQQLSKAWSTLLAPHLK
jgi:hypothetical protein